MLRHFFTNSFGILISRVTGLVRDFLIARFLGAGVYSDIFFVAFKLPNLFRRLFGEGAFSQAFLPNFVKQNQKGLFLVEVGVKLVAAMLLLSLVVMLFAPLFTRVLAAGFSQEVIALAAPLVRINFWYLLLIFCVVLLSCVLQYKNHFFTTAFSSTLLNLAMIVSLILARNLPASQVVFYLSWGVVAGGALQLVSHLFALKKLGLFRLLTFGTAKFCKGARAKTRGFWQNFGAGVLGSSANQLSDFISTFIASFLAAGGISYLYYANRIFQLPLALFAMALSIAIFPQISRQIKNANTTVANALLARAFYLLFALLLFATIGGCVFAKEIIWLLFERGEFGRGDTLNVALVLQGYLAGLLPFGLYKLFSLWLYAHFKQLSAAKISLASLVINTLLSLALFKPYGAFGLALASSISGAFLFFSVVFVYGWREFLRIFVCVKSFATLLAAAAFFFVCVFIHQKTWAWIN